MFLSTHISQWTQVAMNLCFFGKHELTNGMIYNRKIPSDIFHMKN